MRLKLSFHHRPLLVLSGVLLFLMLATPSNGQVSDSAKLPRDTTQLRIAGLDTIPGLRKDSVKKRVYVPRIAAIRSALLPGLGQIYNRKYWKLALVYGALGATGYVFFDNLKTYKESRFAYAARIKASLTPVIPLVPDSTDFNRLSPQYKYLYELESIRANRDQFRRYIDYSVLVFILFWGLNVVDATVDAHLKSFDVSPDLTLKFRAGHSEMAGTNGLSLVLTLRNHHGK